jgi:hypothetical protein
VNIKEQTILFSAILLASFFLPIVEWDSFEMSGLNFVLSAHTPGTKYILLLGPFCALFLLLGAIYYNGYAFSQNLVRWLPFITSVIFVVICYKEAPGSFTWRDIYLGGWINLAASLLLIYAGPKKPGIVEYHC